MGNSLSSYLNQRNSNNDSYKINQIEHDITLLKSQLHAKADSNRDGIVSHQELEDYAIQQKILLRQQEETISTLKHTIELKDAEINNLKHAYDEVSRKHQLLIDNANINALNKLPTTNLNYTISTTAVDKFVSELLNDPNINIRLLPDSIEGRIYRNSILLVLSSMQKAFNNINLDVLGHQLRIDMRPTLESQIDDMHSNNSNNSNTTQKK